jgi:transposase-like protein
MSARKLTDADKVEIVKLYRETDETTSTLAMRYDVSHSTISRFLKSTLSPSEYEVLIGQKRSGRTLKESGEPEEVEVTAPRSQQLELPLATTPPAKLRRRRSSEVEETENEPELEAPSPPREVPAPHAPNQGELLSATYAEEASAYREMLGEDLLELQGELADLEEDEEDDDEDFEDGDEEDLEDEAPILRRTVRAGVKVQVLPLSQALIPKTCYLVVDRAAELVARPLKDFGDLGLIPQEEIQERTLPVFDNHRVARRFSNRTQRVIKVPDGKMLQKVGDHLKAKGITRLLIDGQVYSLSLT